MATTYKSFLSNDIASTRTLLHEAIPITGSIVSGTYNATQTTALGSEANIKTFGHGMFESTYDYPYLSSSANHIFDVTVGFHSSSPVSGTTSGHSQVAKKINVYNQMAQYLVGYDHTGSIKKFKLPTTGEPEMNECYFVPFSRLLSKDEIKKGSFTMELAASGNTAFNQTPLLMTDRIKITDTSGSSGYHVDSPAGEYGVLFASSSTDDAAVAPWLATEVLGDSKSNPPCGLIYYQAGICVLSASLFNNATAHGGLLGASVSPSKSPKVVNLGLDNDTTGFLLAATGATISQLADGFRNRVYNISYNNTTELNSTIYFCRVSHNDFNYSSNPTYLSSSQLRVKTRAADAPVTYITTIGLYSADNELLAVAKLSEPLRKDPTNELTLRVRLDY